MNCAGLGRAILALSASPTIKVMVMMTMLMRLRMMMRSMKMEIMNEVKQDTNVQIEVGTHLFLGLRGEACTINCKERPE